MKFTDQKTAARIVAISEKIDAKQREADDLMAEAARLRKHVDDNLVRLSDGEHDDIEAKIVAAERGAARARAMLAGMEAEREAARQADVAARGALLEAAVAKHSATYLETYTRLCDALVHYLQEICAVDKAVEAFLEEAGEHAGNLRRIDRVAREQFREVGVVLAPLYSLVELPAPNGGRPRRVPGAPNYLP